MICSPRGAAIGAGSAFAATCVPVLLEAPRKTAAHCGTHPAGNGSIIAGRPSSSGCRPSRMASTMSGARGVERPSAPAARTIRLLDRAVATGRPLGDRAIARALGYRKPPEASVH
jgi:hypothetical protein